jgi:tetratricopeptide (TPR) repeat protein
MPSPCLVLVLLLAMNFTLATQLGLLRELSGERASSSSSFLNKLMGDSQRLFANHFFAKADIYLHSGFYPSIFEQAQREGASHLSSAASASPEHPDSDASEHHSHAESDQEDSDDVTETSGQPSDWINAFSRHFYPTRHTHLSGPQQREILPWLRLAAELNPNQVATYTVAAYWLRSRSGKVDEAEEFLREGWRANPNSFEILFELGRLYEENRHNNFRAINLFEAALRQWQRGESNKRDADEFTYEQIVAHLARIEEKEAHWDRAIPYLEMLRKVSPRPEQIQKQIDDLRANLNTKPAR